MRSAKELMFRWFGFSLRSQPLPNGADLGPGGPFRRPRSQITVALTLGFDSSNSFRKPGACG